MFNKINIKSYIKIIFIVSFLIFLSSCSETEELNQKYYSTGAVMTGSINTGEYFVSYIDSFDKIDLGAKVGGKVTKLYFSEGDSFGVGTLLASLDASEAKTNYSGVNDVIGNLTELKESTSQMYDKQILSMQSKVEQAEAAYNGAILGLDDVNNIGDKSLETLSSQILDLENTIENTKLQLEQTKKEIYLGAKQSIVSSTIVDKNILVFLDQLFGITQENKDLNEDIEDYLGTKNISLKRDLENNLRKLISEFEDYNTNYENLLLDNNQIEKDDLLTLLKEGLNLNKEIRNLLKNAYLVVDNSIENIYLPIEQINNYKNQITTFQTNIENVIMSVSGEYIFGLEGSINNIDKFDKNSKTTLDNLNNKLDTLNKSYNQSKAQISGSNTDVSTQKNIAKNALDEAKSGLEALIKQKQSALNEINAKISEAKTNRNSAGVMIENANIYAPISGIITKKYVENGQIIGAGNPVYQIADPNNLKVEIEVLENLKNSLTIGGKVLLEIDGVYKQITGAISKIHPTKNQITKKYKVEISIESEEKLTIGTYTKVFLNSETENGIMIPNDAILGKFMIPGVYVLSEGKAEFKTIKILKQNDNFSIISGLDTSEIIIIKGKENIYDGEILK